MKKSSQTKIVDKIGLGPEERELRLGSSFTNPKECAYHTLRYDFKPASVDTNKMATIDVGKNAQITVTVPPNLIYKGSAKPYQKQCIGIIDPETGDFILERLHSNIQVKKTRSENKNMSHHNLAKIDQYISGQKPKKLSSNKSSKSHNMSNTNSNSSNSSGKSSTAKQSKKNKTEFQSAPANMNNLLHIHNNSTKSSPTSQARFPTALSPMNASPPKNTVDNQTALYEWFNSVDSNRSNMSKPDTKKPVIKDVVKPTRLGDEVRDLSDSSSSATSSFSGDSSDSSSDTESQTKEKVCQSDLNTSPDPKDLLKEDLQLSESGSDSD